MDPYVTEAREFALWAHGSIGQTYGDLPYEVHLDEVVQLIATVPHTREMLAAGWLHDVLEDVKAVTRQKLQARFGAETASLVSEVTAVSTKADGPRAVRIALDAAHYAAASPQGQTIKLADVTANLRRVSQLSSSFAAVYVPEKARLLSLLTTGEPELRMLALQALRDAANHWQLTLPKDLFR